MVTHRHRKPNARWTLLGLGLGLGGGGLVAAIAVVVGIGQVAGGRACAAEMSDTATHYVLSGTGNCSYPSRPAGDLYVALSPAEYGRAAACGGYLEVSGPDGSVRAEVIDQCPPCAPGHIDLSEAAFSRIAPLSAGLVRVSYRPVADPPLPAPVALRVKEGSSRYWLALLAMNTGNPLASVELQSAPGRWRALARADFNYWIAPSGAGTGPFTVRLTDTEGHRVTLHGVTLDPGVVQDTRTWMYGPGTAAAPASAAPSPPATTAAAPSTRPAGRRRTPGPASPAPHPASPAPARPATSPASAHPATGQAPATGGTTQAPAARNPATAPSC